MLTLALLFHLATSDFCQEKLPDDAVFEDLQDKITRCHLHTPDQVIPLLSDAHLSNYVLIKTTQSLQEASPDAPRAILYGKDAKLVVAFNGKTSQVRNDHLEVMQYRAKTDRFEMRDLDFSGSTVVISAPNPRLCTSCHRVDPRPNWETYPLWSGAYGGEDDSIYRKDASLQHGQDWIEFNEFIKSGKKQGRYRYLADLPKPELPNTTFGSALQSLNQLRLARKIAEASVFSPYRYAMVGASACFYANQSHKIEEFIPASVRSRFKTTLKDTILETARTNQNRFLSNITVLQETNPSAPEQNRIQELVQAAQDSGDAPPGQVSDQIAASLMWLANNQGFETGDWGMQMIYPSLDFENGYVGIADFKGKLSHALLTDPDDQDLVKNLQATPTTDLEEVCNELKSKSLRAFSSSFKRWW